MCGIFGACALPQTHFTSSRLRKIRDELFRLSESRGKEAAGLAIRNQEQLSVFKRPMAASKFIRNKPYQRFFDDTICSNGSQSNSPLSHPITFIGHSRLTTNGLQYINYNNQPVINEGFVGVHNGIITNESAIRERLPQLSHQLDVDTEVILSLLRHYYLKEGDIVQATRSTYQQIMGTAAIAVLAEDLDSLILSTNCGSLYFGRNRQQTVLFFSSERFILEQLLRFDHLEDEFGEFTITPIKANSGFLVGIDDLSLHPFLFDEPPRQQQPTGHKLSPLKIADYSEDEERARRALHR